MTLGVTLKRMKMVWGSGNVRAKSRTEAGFTVEQPSPQRSMDLDGAPNPKLSPPACRRARGAD